MSRRYVKKAKWNSLNEIHPEVVAVVSAKDAVETASDEQKYFQRNYLDAVRQIIPKFYFSDEAAISGVHVSFPDQLINSHILAVKNQQTVFPLSGLEYDTYLSSLDSPEGLASYFYTTKPPSQIDADDFNRDILAPLGASLNQFGTSAEFAHYVSGTLLPKIPSIHAGHHESEDLATLTASAYANDSSGTYSYLATNLGWFYFLNRSGPSFDASTALPQLLNETIWKGRPLVLEDNINVFEEHLWKNNGDWGLTDRIVPAAYTSGTDTSAEVFTSGTQLLDRLQTLNSIVYSPHFLNSTDSKVESAFNTFFSTSTPSLDGALIDDTIEAGPLTRFLEAMSFSIAEGVGEQAELNTLYDIGKCPQEFLELLGELIGWKFIGADFDKWRVQLRNAVQIYKMKGTKRAIQYMLDTLFSVGVFNATTSDTLTELWESYIPDILYYSLATSSEAFGKDEGGNEKYTKELATQFGVNHYDPNSMDKNIKFLVDKIIFDLVREFPDSFVLGGNSFPIPHLLLEGVPYTGMYNIKENLDPTDRRHFPVFWTGSRYVEGESERLTLQVNENFLFNYRGRVYLVPPYEKRQYYTATQVGGNMIERIEFYLKCYGVDKKFAKAVTKYIRDNTGESLDAKKVINNFLIYTPEKTYPPNYATILRDASVEKTPDPLTLLSMWNGKSSHFLMSFDASTFDWETQQLTATSRYGLTKVLRVIDQVVPAHAIPEVFLTISSVADGLDSLADNDCREWRPNFNDLYEGSSTVTTAFGVCAVDMMALGKSVGIPYHGFKRTQVDNINDLLLSGIDYIAVPRNSLRRRNYHNLLPENKMFTRGGRNNPGSLELSSPFYSSGIGYLPLGFIPSALHFKEVSLRQNDYQYGIGNLIDREGLDPVWDICQNLSSPSAMFGYQVSNTFPSRIKQNVASSDCNTYGRRGQLHEILYVMNKAHDEEKYLQASSIVSGYYEDVIAGLKPRTVSSDLLVPTDFSSWYAQGAEYGGLDVPRSMGNYLINKEAADESLNYYEHFAFGRPVQELFSTYMTSYRGHGTANLYDLQGGANMFSHTFGPLIYNSTLDTDGSALVANGYLSASSPSYEVNLAYYGGSGLLSVSGMNGKGAYDVGTSCASAAGDLPVGALAEFRNKYLLSAIELVDTSTAYTFNTHPTFSLFKLSRDDQSQYSYAKYLINNQIIKYHRSTQTDSFPRLRINIDNSDTGDLARNFLEPDHEYEMSVKAHCLDASSIELGGLNLSMWLHTQPEQDEIWTYVPDGIYDHCNQHLDKWEMLKVTEVSSVGGMSVAKQKAQTREFATGTLDDPLGTGEGNPNAYTPLTEDRYDYRCFEPHFIESALVGSDPQAITNINQDTLNDITFKFSTKNNSTIQLSETYLSGIGPKLHRKNQKYTIELFITTGHLSKFVVIENIAIKDITNYNKSVIRTKYGDAQLDLTDLKAVFRFLKGLSTGLASRQAAITSGTMEVSGGSRLNYRSNSSMYTTTNNAAYKQLTEVLFDEG